jgi:hypothetical protein
MKITHNAYIHRVHPIMKYQILYTKMFLFPIQFLLHMVVDVLIQLK